MLNTKTLFVFSEVKIILLIKLLCQFQSLIVTVRYLRQKTSSLSLKQDLKKNITRGGSGKYLNEFFLYLLL